MSIKNPLLIIIACALSLNAFATDISGTVNTYVKGDGDVASGSTIINYTGSFRGAGASINPSDVILIIQSQGAEIDSTNTDTYGDGVGTGANISTTPTSSHGTDGYAGGLISQTAGSFEYAVVSGVSGSQITLSSGLQHSYYDTDEANWQIVVVPDYSTSGARLIGNVTGVPWDGDTGGIVAFNATGGTIDFNTFTVDAAEIGFRGGVEGANNATTDNVADVVSAVSDAGGKGEGIAGTPLQVYDGTSVVTEASSTLPGGDFGRGAPGNAGGGAGPHNSGGGGGSNAGRGGIGAQGWVGGTPVHFAGYGGQSIFAGANMGGGGGSGEANDASINHGGVGGGVVLLRANTGIGTGLIDVSGGDAPDATGDSNLDGAGGGGAGGTVLVYFATPPTIPGLNVDASGGSGGDGDPEHGGGGGGGAGLVTIRADVGSVNTTGGAKGANEGVDGVPSEPGGDSTADTGSDAFVRLNTDYGDAPDSYGTISGALGAYHYFADYDFDGVVGGSEELYLGALVDGEGGGNPSVDADSDDTIDSDDEDGVSALSEVDPAGSSYTISAANLFLTNSYGSSATLHAWLDFDLNGTFDSDEYTSITVTSGLSNQNPGADLTWSSTPGVSGVTPGSTTYMRLRLTTDANIDSSKATGEANNGEVEDYSLTVYDALPSPVSITRSNPANALTNANAVVFAVTFSEDVQNVDTSDFSVSGAGSTGATVTTVNGSGNSYTVTVDVGDNETGEVNLDIAATTGIQDLTGNNLTTTTPSGTEETYTLDNTAPGVDIQNVPTTTNSSFTATFQFSEAVSGFDLSDITVGNGVASSFSAVDGDTYTALITPSSDGTVTIDVSDSVATDSAGNNNTAATQRTTTYDATQPSVVISAPDDANAAYTATFEFSENVSDFVLGDITVGNGSASNFVAVDGNTYTALITPSSEGSVTIDVADSVATDAASNNNTAATQAVTTFDTTAPSVAINGTPDDTNSTYTATFEFSEDVIGFTLGDITVGNGSASNFTSVDGNTYTALITPASEGVVTIDVADSVATDAAGNNNTAASQVETNYDTTSPTVTIEDEPATTNSTYTARFEFSENVSGFSLGDITVGNGSASNFTAVDGNTYTALITPASEGTVTIDVASAVAQDVAGNDNDAASQASTIYDTTSPSVAISAPDDANGAYTATFEFSENVTGFTLGEISVGNGAASNFTAVDGNTYTALITPTSEGAVTIDVADAVATDAAGNDNTAASQVSTNYDITDPLVSISGAPDDTNGAYSVTFEFNEDVTDFTLGDITVGNGSASNFIAVDGNTYTALITPASEGTVTIDVAGDVATDAANNGNVAASQESTNYDITEPTVAISGAPANTNGTYTVTFEFSEDVSGFTLGDVTVGNGSASNFTAVDGNTYTALITPASEGAVTVDVASAVAQDVAGNNNEAASQVSTNYDITDPSVTISGAPADTNGTYTVTFEFSEDVTGFSLGDIAVGNGSASNFTAVDDNTYTALITPASEGAVTIDVAEAVAQDAAVNDNQAATQVSTNYDTTAPAVEIQGAPADTNSAFTATFEFSEDVSDFVLGDITVGNGAASNFTAVDDNTYTALITPASEGAVTIDVASAVATDAANNDNEAATQVSTNYDTTAPTVQIQGAPADTNSTFTATFEFSENVSDFVLGDITVGNGAASDFVAVDGNTYTALITPASEGTVTIDVASAVAQDASENDNSAATQASTNYDTTAPSVEIQGTPDDTNSAFTATFEFSEDVSGFALGDITIGNGTASNFVAVDGNTYTALITPASEGAVTIDVGSAVAVDVADNNNTAASQVSVNYDTTAPSVEIQGAPDDTNSAFTATFEFSEDVSDFILADISVGNGSASNFVAVDGNTYTALITPASEGTVTLDVASAVATDAAGNDNTAATQTSTNYDATQPGVAINGLPANTNSAFTATFEFTENVTDFVLADITVANGVASDFNSVDGNTYTALITPSAEGTVTIDVASSVAVDAASNGNTAATQASTVYDTTQPSVLIQNAPEETNSTYTVTFEFSEDVSGFALGDISVANGAASNFNAIDDNTYTALITPASEGNVTIDVAQAVAVDAANNNNTAATQVVTVFDTTQPTVAIQNVPEATNSSFTATFEFSENVSDFVLADIDLSNATASDFVAVDGNTYTATITPNSEGTVTIDVAAAVATDAASNSNIAAAQASTLYDTTQPSVAIQNVPADTNSAFTATFAFSEDVSGFDAADISVANASVSNFTSVDASNYTATISPVSEGAVTIDIASAVASDAAGNGNTAATQASTIYDVTTSDVPSVTILEDVNNNGAIAADELDGAIDVAIGIPANTQAGETLTVDDGNGNQHVQTISAGEVGEVIELTFPAPADGGSINVTANIEDAASNITADGTDSATIDISAPAAPSIEITEDANNDGEINDDELVGDIDVTVTLPGDALAGDDVVVTYGSDSVSRALTTQDITAGNAVLGISNVGNGETLVVESFIIDQAGNQGETSNQDSAFINLDSDNDGLSNLEEAELGTDPEQADTDKDGIPDNVEVGNVAAPNDSDADGVIDALDPDDDNDGIPTALEDRGIDDTDPSTQASDRDGDGIADYLDIDSDGDNLADALEQGSATTDIDNDGIVDSIDADDDGTPGTDEGKTDANGDGVIDEVVLLDTDGDFEPDFIDIDSDNDGTPDKFELGASGEDADSDGIDDLVDADRDGVAGIDADRTDANGDGLDDNFAPIDADQDGLPDYRDNDSDNDGIPDELENGLANTDADGDGIDDAFDADADGIPGTDSGVTDANADGFIDGANRRDSDEDGLADLNDVDSDNDGLPDFIEADWSGVDADNDGIDDAFDADIDATPGEDVPGTDANNDGILDDALVDSDGDGLADLIDADSDNDGIPDIYENGASGVDADNDGIDDAFDADIDGEPGTDPGVSDINGDGIRDNISLPDTDGDGIPDFLDADSDNDGLSDGLEQGISGNDSDGDGIDDAYDADTDGEPGTDSGVVDANGDGIIDDVIALDSDNDGIPNAQDLDSDNDGISDTEEAGLTDSDGNGAVDGGTVIDAAPDQDNDGIADYLDTDSDNDGFPDIFESGNGEYDQNGDGVVDDSFDSDGDGIADVLDDGADFGLSGDTDGDGIPNSIDTDDDNDGIADADEQAGVPALSGQDSDGDGIDDAIDVDQTGGADVNNDGIDDAMDGDSDNDGIPDSQDTDADNDGIPDILEGSVNTDSDNDGLADYLDSDSDNDGIIDGDEDTQLPVLSGNDSDADGVDDALDVDLTGGQDNNANGVDDALEPSDSDQDGIADHLDADSDNDGIPDLLEGAADSDGDGLVDSQDADSDNDGIPDALEAGNVPALANNDSDADGIDDAIDADLTGGLDQNGNGIDDAFELIDTDGDGIPNAQDADSDGDGIPDAVETPQLPVLSGVDSDGDGIDDFIDVDQTGGQDANGDGVDDLYGPADTDQDGIPNYLDVDSDNDGLSDGIEAGASGEDVDQDGIDDAYDVDFTGGVDSDGDGVDDAIQPLNSDADGVANYLDLDSDNDGIFDVVEAGLSDEDENGQSDNGVLADFAPNDDGDDLPNYLDPDSDGDGVSDLAESGNADLDSDGDGQVDNATDSDGDGVPDAYDYEGGSFGGSLDSDGDGIPNHQDLDDDNDGILDTIELAKRVAASGLDANNNGIDDAWDAVLTGGVDRNQDGLDDVLYGDTDGDGKIDSLDLDSDNDGILDTIESGLSASLDANRDGRVDSIVDTNADGLDDRINTNDTVLNSDGQDNADFQDLDADNDGISDLEESGTSSALDQDRDGQIDSTVDTDKDGVADQVDGDVESGNGQSGNPPSVRDTDNDGIADYLDEDSDGDGFNDRDENGDFDGDGQNDGLENSGELETAVNGAGTFNPLSIVVLLIFVAYAQRKKLAILKMTKRNLSRDC
ncbi:hypothetical protein TDB9533_00907 [Thalassocella blandensis]|nr:hypothetical protein TDB9533_00907 [Thalassocella blandensis]